jgi:hypothetical protein
MNTTFLGGDYASNALHGVPHNKKYKKALLLILQNNFY